MLSRCSAHRCWCSQLTDTAATTDQTQDDFHSYREFEEWVWSKERANIWQDGIKFLTTDQTHGWGSRSGSRRTVWSWIHTHTPREGWRKTAETDIQPIIRLFFHLLHPRSWSGWSRAESRRYRLTICDEAPSYLFPDINKWIGSTERSHVIVNRRFWSALACDVQFQNESFIWYGSLQWFSWTDSRSLKNIIYQVRLLLNQSRWKTCILFNGSVLYNVKIIIMVDTVKPL